MPKITVDAKTTFNPLSDLAKISAFYTRLAAADQTNCGRQIVVNEPLSYNCAYYTLADNLTCNGMEFSVGQNFLCKKAVGKEAYHCVFIGHQLGEGFFAKVYSVDTIVEVTPSSYLPYGGYAQPKVIKEQAHCACTKPLTHCGEYHNPIDTLKQEYMASAKINYLGVETPQVVRKSTNISYTVMNELSGIELNKVILDDEEKVNILTIKERMDLTLELYKALKQVSDLGVIHRDLKPANIMVNMAKPISVKILDYGFAKNLPIGQKSLVVSEASGTPIYVAPEIFRSPIIISPATDLYSVTRVLLRLWGGFDSSFRGIDEHKLFMRRNIKVINLFRLLPKEQLVEISSFGLAEDIKALFEQGLMREREERGTVEEAITTFERICSNYAHKGQSAANSPEEPKVVATGGEAYNGTAKACAALGGHQPDKVESTLLQPRDNYGPIFASAAAAADIDQPAFPKSQGVCRFAIV